MTRVQTAAASLVAAVPAGILCALLVMVFLNHAENLKTMTQALVGGTLVVTAVVTLLPFGVLIFGGRSGGKGADKGKAGATSGKAADDGTIATSDDIVASEDDLEIDEDTETVMYQDAVDDEADTAEVFEDDDFSTTDEEDFVLSDDDIEAYEDDEDSK